MKATIFFTIATLFSTSIATANGGDCVTSCLTKADDASGCNMDVQCACNSQKFKDTGLSCVQSCGISDEEANSQINKYRSQFCS
ncbi:uncharacterized protein ASPGLDRAFT_53437 [Aspergillus glaucus CBS 516.65]|uniref:CFEM domain-containing protein n=1 Tax=Aspergillus glaucus CBS 516.65 TaxID=1160497 RepID=A0A1L9V429_ASPGL|nr:hypothetical protein ASPGLDRAFT_53437 [Aspergillus glaucus CBS 516.65]OJJ78670.1 hypothetical protein ASPGLDRAFT_53437 [Aspergillus glaucus CBS 516.65]